MVDKKIKSEPALKKPVIAAKKILFVFGEALKVSWKVNPKLLVIVISLGIFWGLTTIPALYITKIVLDTAIGAIGKKDILPAVYTITFFLGLRFLIDLVRSICNRLANQYRWSLNRQVDDYLDTAFGLKYAELDLETISDPKFRNKYEKIRRETGNRIWGLVQLLSEVPQNITGVISAAIIITTVAPIMLPIALLFAIPSVVFSSSMTKVFYELDTRLSPEERMTGLISRILHFPKNELDQKLLGNSKILAENFVRLRAIIMKAWLEVRIKNNVFGEIIAIPSDLMLTIFNIWLFVQAILQKITLGTAQMTSNAVMNLQNNLSSLLTNFTTMYEHYLYIQEYLWLMNLKPTMKSGGKLASKTFSQGIEFKNVWFKYPLGKTWILKNINFKVGAKENLAIVGENGAGKTTLIKLLCRFYAPSRGEIFVNGVNIMDYDEKSYWKSLSALFQGFEQYPFSVKETIGYGDVERLNKISEIVEAAKKTEVDEFIQTLPQKYDTPLAKDLEGGIEPSSGQWQRLGLARAIFRRANMILLDEPTSNVDPKAEEEIFEKVIELAREKILILISHRFSTVRRADKIILIENGHLTEEGTHGELMKKDKSYAKLFSLQAKGYQ